MVDYYLCYKKYKHIRRGLPMVIGTRKLDDVELMRGNSVPAERIELGNKVSLFDFSEENKQRLLNWENLELIMVNPYEFNWNTHNNRVRNALLVEVSDYLNEGQTA